MKTLISLILCALCFSQAQATLRGLSFVKQPLYLLNNDDNCEIKIADVPYVTNFSNPGWIFRAICSPCRPSGDTSRKDAEDVNLVSLYKIWIEGESKPRTKNGSTYDTEVTIDLSKAAVPGGYPFTIEQVTDAAVTCIRLMYPARPVSEGKLEIKIVGGKPDVKKIRELRNGKNAEQGDKLMQEFVAAWKPVGKPIAELQSLLGEPTDRTSNSIIYRFDSGFGGWDWVFKTSNDRVTEVVRNGID